MEVPAGAGASLAGLFRALSRDASALIRLEFALARAELRRNVRAVARRAALAVLGASAALLGLLVLLAALVVGVGDLMGGRYALGALAVGLVLLAAGGGVALLGLRRARQAALAPGTVATLRDTGRWARAEARELRAGLTTAASRGGATAGTERRA